MISSEFELRMQRKLRRKMLSIGAVGLALIYTMAAIVDIKLLFFLMGMSVVLVGCCAIIYAVVHWE